jgi:predicted nucleotidyltransferase
MSARALRLSRADQGALDAYIARLHNQYRDRLQRVVLFGSKARGDADAASDLDVLVVLDDGDWRLRDAVALLAFEPMMEHGVVLSPLVVDTNHYVWWQRHNAPIYHNIVTDGVELWTKPQAPLSKSG